MTQNILFTAGTSPACWMPLAQDLLRNVPQGIDLSLGIFKRWLGELFERSGESPFTVEEWLRGLKSDDPLLQELRSLAGDRRTSWGVLDERCCWVLASMSYAHPAAQLLLFIESPTNTLARTVLTHDDCNATAVLDEWAASARSLLRVLHADPSRCILIDAADVRLDPTVATLACRERTGIAFRAPAESSQKTTAPDPLAKYLAELAVQRHPESRALYEELELACLLVRPLAGGEDDAPRLETALARLREFEQARSQLAEASTQRDAATSTMLAAVSERDATRADSAELLTRQHSQQEQLAHTLLQLEDVRSESRDLGEQVRRQAEQLAEQATSALVAQRELERLQIELAILMRERDSALAAESALRQGLVEMEVSRETAHRHREELQVQLESALKSARVNAGELEQQIAILQEVSAERQRWGQELEERCTALQQALSHRDALVAELGSTAEQREQQIVRLQEVSAEHQRKGQELEERCTALQQALSHRDALVAELGSTAEQREQQMVRLQEVSAERQRWGLELSEKVKWHEGRQDEQRMRQEALLDQVRRAGDEKRALIGQMQSLHQELDDAHEKATRLEERLPYVGASRAAGIEVAPAAIGRLRDSPPHRELSFDVPQLMRPGATTSIPVSARLVEHLGNPGLVLFSDDVPPLERWNETGKEGERSFMLLVPSDAAGRDSLDRLSGSDWLVIQALLSAFDRALCLSGDRVPARWSVVLARLRSQLDALPPRPRFDRLQFRQIASEGQVGVALEADGVDCLGRWHSKWRLDWWPSPSGGRLDWIAGPGGWTDLPLLCWPLDGSGAALDRMTLKMDGLGDREARRNRWISMPTPDVQLLRALTSALPDWLGSASRDGAVIPGLVSEITSEQLKSLAEAARALSCRIDDDLRVPWLLRIVRSLRHR